jgi:hypothetical protein
VGTQYHQLHGNILFSIKSLFDHLIIISLFRLKNKVSIQDEIESGRIIISSDDNCNYKLLINECQTSDTGTYSLKAKNLLAEVCSNAQVSVLSSPKFIKELNIASSSALCTSNEVQIGEKYLTKFTLNEKSQVKLECNVIGIPKPIIKWFKNNEEVRSGDKFKSENKLDNYSLIIKDCTNNEKGVYKVLAENCVGSVINEIILDLNNLPNFTKCLSNSEVILEDNLSLEFTCIYRSKPTAEVFWYFGEKWIQNNEQDSHYLIIYENINDPNGIESYLTTLKIFNLNLADSGTYTCRLKNCVGEISSHSILTVLTQPKIIKHLPKNLDQIEKKELKLECCISESIPKSTIQWLKNGNVLNNSKNITIAKPTYDQETNSMCYSLNILEPLVADSDSYKISASNKIATVESICDLNIISAPRIIKDIKSTFECNEFEKISLELTVVGNPRPEFRWYQFNQDNNSEVELESLEGVFNSYIKSENTYVFEIMKVFKSMQGKYTIKLFNSGGSIETSFYLIVNGNILTKFYKQNE